MTQRNEVTYLGAILDQSITGGMMAKKALCNICGKTKFIQRQENICS